jgi:hypothetical protein
MDRVWGFMVTRKQTFKNLLQKTKKSPFLAIIQGVPKCFSRGVNNTSIYLRNTPNTSLNWKFIQEHKSIKNRLLEFFIVVFGALL